MSKEIIIDVKNLTKKFGNKVVVNHINIALEKGKIYGFLGPNGSGKTTTIRMICGLLTPDEGSGSCLGYDLLKQSSKIKEKVGYMTQKFSFWEDMTIIENLNFITDIYGLSNKSEKVMGVLKKLGLEKRGNQLAGTLSGGWKQRLALGACILHNPEILLLDEPTAGVDPQARRDFWDEIHKLANDGMTFLVSTHYMDEAERCDEIIYISYGNIIVQGKVLDVIKSTDLITYSISGLGIDKIYKELLNSEKVITVAIFGSLLHVSVRDVDFFERFLEKYKDEFICKKIDTSLEDAFIYYMKRSVDNA